MKYRADFQTSSSRPRPLPRTLTNAADLGTPDEKVGSLWTDLDELMATNGLT
jgi:hypothetical protein